MRIVNSCILELREYKGRRIVCQLQFKETSDESFEIERDQDFHWLNKSDWKAIDVQLSKTVHKLEKGVRREKCFQLNDEIDVAVSISSKGVGNLFKILGVECFEKKDYNVSVNCVFNRHSGRKRKTSSADICKGSPNLQKRDLNGSTSFIVAEPVVTVQKKMSSTSSSKVGELNNSARKLNKLKSPKPSSDVLHSSFEVKKTTKTKQVDIDDRSVLGVKKTCSNIQVHSTNGNQNVEYLHNKRYKEKSKEHIPVNKRVSQDDQIDLQKDVTTPQILKECDTKRKKLRSKCMSAKREEHSSAVTDIYKELFDSADDFTDENETKSKWLSKKQPENVSSKKKSKLTISSRVKSPRGCESIGSKDIESHHGQKEQIKANKRIESFLERITQVPEKVKILTLNNMDSDEIINTFPKYKRQLDAIFSELRSKSKVTGYNGINHYSVIELIDNEKQLKMMHKLGEVYEKDGDGVSLYPMLFANALMPEWLVHVFKDKYRFSYSEAVNHLNKQQLYMQYLDTEDHY
ncbi:uncharacterized protein LOC105214383 [Zeugodacus cucurbitae]|uniref:uncharacterized protein LOC105214383 n=1 Tax=Zeugodacus cucurbitae TaxID=28588 RepID=UPI0023D91D0C|nr:uncharacterized protein LOC105214383 [Zeugodacus cucurbitae]XP_054091888.1 uncharacterized protein LOC105214383 [Zeugodacus cucurbitae]